MSSNLFVFAICILIFFFTVLLVPYKNIKISYESHVTFLLIRTNFSHHLPPKIKNKNPTQL